MEDIVMLWYSAIQGSRLSQRALMAVTADVDAPTLERRLIANSIISMVGVPTSRKAALVRIKAICESRSYRESSKSAALLLAVLERIPAAYLKANACFADFAFESATALETPVRINAMRLLRRYAKCGNRKAIRLLKRGSRDQDPYVNKTANASLALALQKI